MEDYKNLYEIFISQSGTAAELWKFYSAVCLGLVAAIIGSDNFKSSKVAVFTVITGFSLFAFGNLMAILQIQPTVIALGETLNFLAVKNETLKSINLITTTEFEIKIFHVVCDVSVCAAIYLIARASWFKESKS